MVSDLEGRLVKETEICQKKGTYSKAGLDKNGCNAWYCIYYFPDSRREAYICPKRGHKVLVQMSAKGIYLNLEYYRCMR